ncbi:MAG: hypothetical protein JW917_03485 [Ignavibacteria bacterium]|nr:hypothetical protein [Ignavibacteria bacterium]
MEETKNPDIVRSNTVFDKIKSKLYFFFYPKYIQVIKGFPDWSAYYKQINTDIWLRFRPEIDVKRNIIYTKYYPFRIKEKFFEYYDRLFERYYTKQIKIPFGETKEHITGYTEFFNLIPKEIRGVASKFLFRQWSVISVCKSVWEFPDLILSNPALAFSLANCWVYNKNIKSGRQISYIKRHIHKKQRRLLGFIGFPEEETYVKLLKKIDPIGISGLSMLKFRENLLNSAHSKRIKKLSAHIKKLNPVIFRIFSDSYVLPLLSNRDLMKLSEKNYFIYDDYFYIKKISYYYNLLYKSLPSSFPIDMLKEYSEELEETYYFNPERAINLQLPQPPFIGNRYIRPLKTINDIYDWADLQENCIVKYIYCIYFRLSYLYRIEYEGETATFEILIESSEYHMGDILGLKNKPVSRNLRQIVLEWFYKKTKGIKKYKYCSAS